jgi:hypothetical protein
MPFEPLDDRAPDSRPLSDPYPFHPLANAFPLIEGDEFFAFCEDIKVNGQQEPITLLDGAILDGRNRYRALTELGVKPVFEHYLGEAPLEFVLSKNMYRRQLTIAQRSMIAAEIVCRNIDHGAPAGDQTGTDDESPDTSHLRPGLGLTQAATLLGISERSVSSAGRVARSGVDELLAAVKNGKVKISAAEYIARLDEEEQRDVCARGAKAIREKARDMREDRRKKDNPQENIAVSIEPVTTVEIRRPMTDSAEALFQFAMSARRRGGQAKDIADQICKELADADMSETETFFFAAEVAAQVRERLLQSALMQTV